MKERTQLNVMVTKMELVGDEYVTMKDVGTIDGVMNVEGNEVRLPDGKILGTFEKSVVTMVWGNKAVKDIWAPDDEGNDYYIVQVDHVRLPELIEYLTPVGMKELLRSLIAGELWVDATNEGLIQVICGGPERQSYASVQGVMGDEITVYDFADMLNNGCCVDETDYPTAEKAFNIIGVGDVSKLERFDTIYELMVGPAQSTFRVQSGYSYEQALSRDRLVSLGTKTIQMVEEDDEVDAEVFTDGHNFYMLTADAE